MEPTEKDDLDRRIREALEPDAEAVHRVVGRAMAGGRRRRRLFLPALAAISVCMAAWLFLAGPPADSPEVLTFNCVGEVAVIQAPDGTSWVLSEDGREPGPGVETGFILYEGDLP